MRNLLAAILLVLLPACYAQQLQTQSAPQPANVKYANGVSPGYALTKGSGLTLNISAGTTQCVDQLAEYAGGTKTLTDDTVNYIYLDPAQDCAPVVNTSGFLQGTVWLGKVTAASGAISAITDDVRTPFAVSKVAITGSGGTGGGTNNQGTVALTGCGVSWIGGLSFTVSPCTFLIAGTQYASAQASLTLTTADATNARIDVIAVDSTGTAILITGMPSGTPAEPSVDPATQLRLIAITVPASSSTPSGVTETDLYLENTEWTSAVSSNFNAASTSNPFAGTKDIEATAAVAGNNVTLTKPSGTLDLSTYSSLVFYIRSKAAWPNAKSLSIFWLNGSTVVGASVSLKTSNFGFNSSTTGTYQQVVVPIGNFGTGTNPINKIKIAVAGAGGSIGFYLDNISLQAGLLPTSGGPQNLIFNGVAPINSPGTIPIGGTVVYSLTAAASHYVLANCTGSSAAPAYCALTGAMLPNPGASSLGGIESLAAVSHNFIDSISTLGVPHASQPDYSDLTGTPTLAANTTATSHQFFTAYNSTTGAFTKAQPDYADLTGTPTLAANTTATSHQFFTAYNSTTGAFTKAQPACADLSDAAASCATDATNASNIGSGTLPDARLGSNPRIRGIPFTIGTPGGTALTAGAGDVDYITVPFACTVAGYNLAIDAGTITVKFWKKATGSAIPTSSDSISTSGVGISSGTAIHSGTTSDFTTTTVSANDIMAMKVTAASGVAYVSGVLPCTE